MNGDAPWYMAFVSNTVAHAIEAKLITTPDGIHVWAKAAKEAAENVRDGKPGIHSPRAGAGDKLAEPKRRFVEGVVGEVKHLLALNEDARAVQFIKGAGMDARADPDERVFMWDHFDSKERARLKRAEEEAK